MAPSCHQAAEFAGLNQQKVILKSDTTGKLELKESQASKEKLTANKEGREFFFSFLLLSFMYVNEIKHSKITKEYIISQEELELIKKTFAFGGVIVN